MEKNKKQLYPLKFAPLSKERVWGKEVLMVSGFEEDSSIVNGGYLDQNPLYDIIETYMGEIVGDDHYKQYGNEFPILAKYLDIKGLLSVQVHPDDETAFDRHNSYGKNEAWYILDAEPDGVVYIGFSRDISPNEFYERCKAGTLQEVLNAYHPKRGDFFFIEAGTIHSAGHGVKIAEVQQLSDVTYRVYDWGRENSPSTRREMHLEYAFDCVNYSKFDPLKSYSPSGEIHLAHNRYFNINSYRLTDALHIYTNKFNSFILYYCIDGQAILTPDSYPTTAKSEYTISAGEWILIPAEYEDFVIKGTESNTQILEVYVEVPQDDEHDSYIDDHECECGEHHHHHQ